MIKIEVGGEYAAAKVVRGNGANGEYEFIIVKDENPKVKKEVKVWAKKPTGMNSEQNFRLEKIYSVKRSARKYNDIWLDEVHVEADVTPLMTYSQYNKSSSTFRDLDDSDGELPF